MNAGIRIVTVLCIKILCYQLLTWRGLDRSDLDTCIGQHTRIKLLMRTKRMMANWNSGSALFIRVTLYNIRSHRSQNPRLKSKHWENENCLKSSWQMYSGDLNTRYLDKSSIQMLFPSHLSF